MNTVEDGDTIVAVATPPGRGGIGIVRVSGPAARAVAEAVIGEVPRPRHAVHRAFRDDDGTSIDDGLAVFFPAPRSFTGEDVLELHGHGGPVVMDLLLARATALGARAARPGEFSERAFLNGRMDLAQAEAVADVIEAGTATAARAARRSLDGAFSREVHALVEALVELRTYVEGAIDFPEDEIDFITDGDVAGRLRALVTRLRHVETRAQQGVLLREGMTLVIAGRPNAGKSSLLNALSGRDSAIVTEVPGTTRDVLRESIQIDGLPLHVIDTAGLRDSADPIEREGVRRAWGEIERADRVVLVVDDTIGIGDEEQAILARLPQRLSRTVVRSKIDLSGRAPGADEDDLGTQVGVSAITGAGLDALRAHLKQTIGYEGDEDAFLARRRHLDALARARAHLAEGRTRIERDRAGELLAEELRAAQRALGEITGEFTSDDLLGRIFSTFCIGK